MITSLLRRLLGKPSVPKAQRQSALRQKSATIVPVRRHKIDPKLISANAIKVTSTLQQAGYQAYIVGGAVRDLLLNIAPKDFDVATNATPEQVQALFRRARLIGRRFQIVHVVFYTGREQEIIEVSTFRAPVDSQTSTQLNEKTSLRTERRRSLDTHSHTVDMHGRVLRDNVWGDQAADAARRDFTINAMYYDPADQTVHDYHAGIADIQARVLRIIGDPVTRYREDPIRMLRAVRFAAKTGFTLATETAAPIAQLAALIDDVPAARVFDEMLKLLLSGHAWASLQQLRQAGLHHGLLPLLDVIVEQPGSEHFVQLALANTDARIANNKTVSPGFLFAALFWRQVQSHWQARKNVDETPTQSLYAAMDTVLEQQTQTLAIQRRHVGDMKDIWALQPRFERRIGRAPLRLLEAPRFRAGYDFLLLR
ncbi:MAG: polynucleotide adenylyltransferase PcnB, partial [Ottowia sp.]|nr:polynucleotide adenylyltransferase PcnB [Ottowia sp.]